MAGNGFLALAARLARLEFLGVTRRKRAERVVFIAFLFAMGCVGYHFFWRYHVKRYQVVQEGMFYRTAQPTEFGLRRLIEKDGIKTVICLQLYRPRLKRGLYDHGRPDGLEEREFAQQLGAQYLEWPQGEEACWPWPTPWMYEEFFKLLDEPSNRPVVVHCMGGRHRTGTLSALFRLEYDRWTVQQTLDEMYSFQFGQPLSLHEHNLRTYFVRPRPDAATRQKLLARFEPVLREIGASADNYEALVYALRAHKADPRVERAIRDNLDQHGPFALCLAQRIIDEPADPLAIPAAAHAAACLANPAADPGERASAAGLVADFGSVVEQEQLLDCLTEENRAQPPSPRYQALAIGVTNRYTRNRLAFLRPLLADKRQRPEPGLERYRYCDTAMARLSVIIDCNLMEQGERPPGLTNWQYACQLADEWMAAHETETRLSQLVPPAGNNELLTGELPSQEDLSRMRK